MYIYVCVFLLATCSIKVTEWSTGKLQTTLRCGNLLNGIAMILAGSLSLVGNLVSVAFSSVTVAAYMGYVQAPASQCAAAAWRSHEDCVRFSPFFKPCRAKACPRDQPSLAQPVLQLYRPSHPCSDVTLMPPAVDDELACAHSRGAVGCQQFF
jgi:hypothetical protein